MAAISIEKNGFITFQSLIKDLAGSMDDNGFGIYNVDGSRTNSRLSIDDKILFKPNENIDGAYQSQPWVFTLMYSEEDQWIDFYVTGIDQVIDIEGDFRIANKRVEEEASWQAGKLTKGSQHLGEEDEIVRSMSFANWEIPDSDTQANPMSYRLTISDHGFSLYIWVESYDSSGQKFFWLCTQRMVDYDGVPVTTGKAPLFCLFANQGYPSDADSDYAPNPDSVYKFVVRESDVNSPTYPISAVEDSADSSRIMNVAQQVSLRENNSVVLYFPNNLNTQRYAYPHQLDMVGVISADVVSQSTDLNVQTFDEPTPRIYRGMNADQINNKGARLMFWVGNETE